MRNYPLNWEFIVKPKKNWRQNCRISRRNTEKLLIYYTILKMNSKPLKNDLIRVWVNIRSPGCLRLRQVLPMRRKRLKVNFWTLKLVKKVFVELCLLLSFSAVWMPSPMSSLEQSRGFTRDCQLGHDIRIQERKSQKTNNTEF